MELSPTESPPRVSWDFSTPPASGFAWREHGLVLGGGRDVSMHRQVSQERLDRGFGGEKVFARTYTVVQTEHPSHVSEEFRL